MSPFSITTFGARHHPRYSPSVASEPLPTRVTAGGVTARSTTVVGSGLLLIVV